MSQFSWKPLSPDTEITALIRRVHLPLRPQPEVSRSTTSSSLPPWPFMQYPPSHPSSPAHLHGLRTVGPFPSVLRWFSGSLNHKPRNRSYLGAKFPRGRNTFPFKGPQQWRYVSSLSTTTATTRKSRDYIVSVSYLYGCKSPDFYISLFKKMLIRGSENNDSNNKLEYLSFFFLFFLLLLRLDIKSSPGCKDFTLWFGWKGGMGIWGILGNRGKGHRCQPWKQ